MHRPNRAPEVSARLPVPSLWAALARLASLVFPPPCTAPVKGRKIVPSPRKPTCEPTSRVLPLVLAPGGGPRGSSLACGAGGAAAVEQRLQRKLTSNAVSWSSSGIFF